jgi:putative membrane protein
MTADPFRPRVIEVEPDEAPLRVDAPPQDEGSAAQGPQAPRGPQVIMTERSEPIVPVQPARVPALPAVPERKGRTVSVALAGLGIGVAGWLTVDAYWWVAAAFERSMALGGLATFAVAAGVTGAGAIVARELRSLWKLRNVEHIRARLADEVVRPRDARAIINDIIAVVPQQRETRFAIEAFQRQVQPHHTVAQQVEILSRTVMQPLDRRAEAHVRSAVLRAFGITAISPTALSDAAFFLACGVRMVRAIAAEYGHRPTAAATTHILRRLLFEAGKLGAVDIASSTLMQHLGGAAAERIATSAADSLYASYRMARLGVIVMDLCRPIPFRNDDVPSISSLVGNLMTRRPEERR